MFVLTTRDKPACIRFYTEVLGMKLVTFRRPKEERPRVQLRRAEDQPARVGPRVRAEGACPRSGIADLCFIASVQLDEVIRKLALAKVRSWKDR